MMILLTRQGKARKVEEYNLITLPVVEKNDAFNPCRRARIPDKRIPIRRDGQEVELLELVAQEENDPGQMNP